MIADGEDDELPCVIGLGLVKMKETVIANLCLAYNTVV